MLIIAGIIAVVAVLAGLCYASHCPLSRKRSGMPKEIADALDPFNKHDRRVTPQES